MLLDFMAKTNVQDNGRATMPNKRAGGFAAFFPPLRTIKCGTFYSNCARHDEAKQTQKWNYAND